MYRNTWRAIKGIIGVLLIIIGIISGFIPILQGWVFILAGLLLLGVKTETIKKWANNAKKRIKRIWLWGYIFD